jgi:hypothetical protein
MYTFGTPGRNHRTVKLRSCPLCLQVFKSIEYRKRSDLEKPNVLCLDGGGTRGLIPLAILNRLQNKTGLPLLIQDFFDFGVATSSGRK